MPEQTLFEIFDAACQRSINTNTVILNLINAILERLDSDETLDRGQLRKLIQDSLKKIK